jgi:hypothetical protein
LCFFENGSATSIFGRPESFSGAASVSLSFSESGGTKLGFGFGGGVTLRFFANGRPDPIARSKSSAGGGGGCLRACARAFFAADLLSP